MSILEDRSFLKERKAEREALAEAAAKKEKDDFNQMVIDRENKIAAHEAAIDRFYAYKDSVKKVLVEKALAELCTQSIPCIGVRETAICENLIDQYIDEVGTTKLLRNMKFSENGLLHTIAEKVEEYASDITKDANADDVNSQTISRDAIENFWKDIDKSEDIADITNIIRIRVSNAEEEFINKNQEDKENVRTVLAHTSSRIQNAKATNDNDYSDAVEESETRLAKEKIYQIQHEGNRNVFDRMVRNISEAAMSNEDAKIQFTKKGKLDMDKIVESARCMYTLLETVATIQLEKVDGNYIEETLNSIK